MSACATCEDGHVIRPQVLHPRSIERHRSRLSFLDCSDSQERCTTGSIVKSGAALRASITACRVDAPAVIAQTRGARGIGRVHLIREATIPEPRKAKPAEAAGLQSGEPGSSLVASELPLNRRFQALVRATGDVRPGGRFRRGCCCTPEAALFQSSPSPSRPSGPAEPEHRWLLTCFSRYVDRAGRAFPSLRQLAARRPHVAGRASAAT